MGPTDHPYMAFCASTRSTATWKNTAKGLSAAQQGAILGRMYRSRTKAQMYRGSRSDDESDDGSDIDKLTQNILSQEVIRETLERAKQARQRNIRINEKWLDDVAKDLKLPSIKTGGQLFLRMKTFLKDADPTLKQAIQNIVNDVESDVDQNSRSKPAEPAHLNPHASKQAKPPRRRKRTKRV